VCHNLLCNEEWVHSNVSVAADLTVINLSHIPTTVASMSKYFAFSKRAYRFCLKMKSLLLVYVLAALVDVLRLQTVNLIINLWRRLTIKSPNVTGDKYECCVVKEQTASI